jgi:hypothetical protein
LGRPGRREREKIPANCKSYTREGKSTTSVKDREDMRARVLSLTSARPERMKQLKNPPQIEKA